MKIGILGTGGVGQTLAAAWLERGHEVMVGTREVQASLNRLGTNGWGQPEFGAWHRQHSEVQVGTFAEAAAYGELLVNATSGSGSLPALHSAGAEALGDKVLLDIANDLDFSSGMPPLTRTVDRAGSSLGEQIQAAFPDLRVVKTLNTMTAGVMVNPALAGGESTVFLSGNDPEAKQTVRGLLEGFGWTDILDLGDIGSSRAVELLLPLWLRAWGALGQAHYNFKIVR